MLWTCGYEMNGQKLISALCSATSKTLYGFHSVVLVYFFFFWVLDQNQSKQPEPFVF